MDITDCNLEYRGTSKLVFLGQVIYRLYKAPNMVRVHMKYAAWDFCRGFVTDKNPFIRSQI